MDVSGIIALSEPATRSKSIRKMNVCINLQAEIGPILFGSVTETEKKINSFRGEATQNARIIRTKFQMIQEV